MKKEILVIIALGLCAFGNVLAQQKKPNVVVLSDIEADPDDTQSLIRFLLYSNQFNVEGLIATTSIHQKTFVSQESITAVLDIYKGVRDNLLKHEPGYPSYEDLISKTRSGLAVYGMAGVGKGKDSPGSDMIIRILERPDNDPVWFTIWGGPNTLAQALWKMKEEKKQPELARILKKIRIYTISDQDDSGPWIRKNFPDVFFVVTPGYNYTKATWLGISFPMPGSNAEVSSNKWLADHIQQGHGPLGAAYPDVAYGMEGDTPAFLNLIDNGLNDSEHPNYGGWGGRYEYYLPEFVDSNSGRFRRENWPKDEPETRAIWTNTSDSVISAIDKKAYFGNRETIWRWREDFQNDFAARIDWTTKSVAECNHPPVVKLDHADKITVKSGEHFSLSAKGTKDPDGDSMSYFWLVYKEAGSFKGAFSMRPYSPNLYRIPDLVAPVVKKPETLHFIVKVTDKGTPAITRYKRIIVTVTP